jgi:hypothetical protein
LIAPNKRVVSVTVVSVPPTSISRVTDVADERSRSVDAETPMLPRELNGIDAAKTGKRAVVVVDLAPECVSRLNSGSY